MMKGKGLSEYAGEKDGLGWFIPVNKIANGDFDWCSCGVCDCWNTVDDTGDICEECLKGNHFPEEATDED